MNNQEFQPAENLTPNQIKKQSASPRSYKKLIVVIAIIVVLLGLGAGAYWYFTQPEPSEPVVCPQTAIQCPDGSYVSRTGPNCEFAACPSANPDQNQAGCDTDSDCQNGASCMVTGPIIANQPVHKVCVPKGQVVPL